VSIFDLLATAKAALDPITSPVLIGPEYLAENGAPPRIVCIPIGGTIASGTQDVSDFSGSSDTNRPIAADVQTCEIHVWGADYAAALVLRDAFVATISDLAHGAYMLSPWNWTQGTKIAVDGRELTFVLGCRIPVVVVDAVKAPIDTTAEVTATSAGIQQPTPGDSVVVEVTP
jgi:hypothetical protein